MVSCTGKYKFNLWFIVFTINNGKIKLTASETGVVEVNSSEVSAYLKKIRQENSLTQRDVADRLGVTPQAVSKWERCESLPDITLLPELAEMYGVSIEEILNAGHIEQNYAVVLQRLNTFVDKNTFEQVRREFEDAACVAELNVPLDFFMALNNEQRDALLGLLLDMDGYTEVIDDILQYLNLRQRERLIRRVAEDGDYHGLEMLLPFMTKSVRTEIVILLLERNEMEFLEEMVMFLNREQKDLVIHYVIDNNLGIEALDSFLPFFDKEQLALIKSIGEQGEADRRMENG